MGISKFNVYSLAIVAANKPLSSKVIECTPTEIAPMTNGEVSDTMDKYTAGATDREGAAYQVEMTTTNTVKATWLPMGGSNRMTAPDVRRGELVILYRFADTDELWWATLKDDMHLRKLETVIYAFSGSTVESAKADSDNMYFLEVSTHNKLVHFHTSKANGEPYSYDIQINTQHGFIKIQDDVGNFIGFDSKENQLEMVNRDGSKLDINKKNITIESTNSITLKSKTVTVDATDIVDKATSIKTNASTITIAGSGSVVITGSPLSVN